MFFPSFLSRWSVTTPVLAFLFISLALHVFLFQSALLLCSLHWCYCLVIFVPVSLFAFWVSSCFNPFFYLWFFVIFYFFPILVLFRTRTATRSSLVYIPNIPELQPLPDLESNLWWCWKKNILNGLPHWAGMSTATLALTMIIRLERAEHM